MNTPQDLKVSHVAMLSGVEFRDPEATNDTIVYHLETNSGQTLAIDLHYVLKLLLLFCKEGFIPPLPQDWINQAARIYGKVFQEDA